MDINATLIGNTAAFLVFVLFCYKFVWPPIEQAITQRQQFIADSLNEANEAKNSIEQNKRNSELEVLKAKEKAKEIVVFAERQAAEIIEKAKQQAQEQAQQLVAKAHSEIEHERVKVEQELRAHVSNIAISIAEKILEREVSEKDNEDLINKALSKL